MKTKSELILEEFERVLHHEIHRYKKWVTYADKLLNIRYNGKAKKLYNATDIVNEIMVKTIDGNRDWDREKVPNLDIFMIMTIKSEVWNKINKEKKIAVFDDAGIESNENEEDDNNKDVRDVPDMYDPIHNEKRIDYEERLNTCFESVKDDKDSEIVLLMVTQGFKNQEIAEDLGITVREVEIIKKRIKRRLNKIKF